MSGAHNIINSLAASPQNPGSVIHVSKNLGSQNTNSAHQVNSALLDYHHKNQNQQQSSTNNSGNKNGGGQLRETPVMNTTVNSTTA